jgi:hypothetical protein
VDYRKYGSRLKREFRQLLHETSGILLRYDPMQIGPGVPPDEYESEAGEILGRMRRADSLEDATKIVEEVFTGAFDDLPSAKAANAASQEIWNAWVRYLKSTSPEPPVGSGH